MTPLAVRRRFTVGDFHRMAEAGILAEDDRVELIDGEILAMTPIGPKHAHCVRRLIASLALRVGTSAIIDVQNPLLLGEDSEPQPDVVLLKQRADFYKYSHPGPDDVLLAIEVADSSSDYDRTVKLPQYARAGIPEVWLIDLTTRVVEVYRGPVDGTYTEHHAAGPGNSLQPPGVVGQLIAIDDIF